MSSPSWNEIKRVFHQVQGLAPGDRLAEIKKLSPNPEVVNEVQWLLGADTGLVDFLRDDASQPFLNPPPSAIEKNALLGSYRIIDSLGQGGMGAVYLAVRTDDFEKQVAIKILSGRITPQTSARFQRERQILADLDHPNIARLFDGGTTETGLPYLVMEYVEGRPLDLWIKEHNPNFANMIDIFRKICAAVHFAHQNLIVHRDLKPANILITPQGEPKLLDFGIARLLNDNGQFQTQTGHHPMTPQYASPEQVHGKPVTITTDVYGLGLLLFELLAGHPAQKLENNTPEEILRVVCEEDPFKTQLPENEINHRPKMDGDLEWITRRALRKEPEERYASALQMKEDLDRHVNGYPVLARQGNWRYRVHRFVKRNLVAVFFGVAFSLTIIGSLIALALLNQQANAARVKAQLEKQNAENTAAFLQDLFHIPDPLQTGEAPDIQQLLDKASDKLMGEAGSDLSNAKFSGSLGKVFYNLGQYDKALPLLEKGLSDAKAQAPPDPKEMVQFLLMIGKTTLAMGEIEKARSHFETCETLLTGESYEEKASVYTGLAETAFWDGDYEMAKTWLLQVLEIQLDHVETPPLKMAEVYYNLGFTLAELNNYGASETLFRDALAIRERELGPNHPETAAVLYNLATQAHIMGDIQDAVLLFQETIAIEEETLGLCHPDLSATYSNLALVHKDLGQYNQADFLFKQALDINLHTYDKDHPEIGAVTNNIALNYLEAGDLKRSEEYYAKALDIFHLAYGSDHHLYAIVLNGLGKLNQKQGAFDLGEGLLCEALEIGIRSLGWENLQVTSSLLNLALLQRDRGDIELSKAWLARARDSLESAGEISATIITEINRLESDLADSDCAKGAPIEIR